MEQDTDQLKYDIERRREDIEGTLDAIGDRVLPGRIVERRREQLRQGVQGVRERVMGRTHEMTGAASGAASSAAEHVGPDALGRQVSGHPLGAGLVAAGLGFLVSAAIPRSSSEVQMARSVADAAAPLAEQAQQAVREVARDVADEAASAGSELKETASAAASDVTEEAKHQARAVRDELRE